MARQYLTFFRDISSSAASRKACFAVAIAVVLLIVIDNYFTTSLDYSSFNSILRSVLFMTTVVVGYALGSWFLLGYAKRMSSEMKSPVITIMRGAVTIIQFF